MSITCTTSVLEQVLVDSEQAIFQNPADTVYTKTVILARETWDDLGSPVEITVSVRPDDRLNDNMVEVLR